MCCTTRLSVQEYLMVKIKVLKIDVFFQIFVENLKNNNKQQQHQQQQQQQQQHVLWNSRSKQ